jgi:hypothetical protein
MESKTRTLQDYLIQIARKKDLTTYTEAGKVIGLDMASESGRILIAQILDEINIDEVSQGYPMISSLVIYKDNGRPGPGYFNCARGLNKLRDNDEDGFWAKEVAAVHNWWATH